MGDPVAIVGATGMIARPLVRRLHSAGRPVRCLVRSPARAAALLPAGVEVRRADLRDPHGLAAAIEGCGVVYANLAQPQSRGAWDPDLEGTRAVVAAARDAGARRILRISTMGCPAWRDRWWVIERKARADDLVRESGMAWTILRPTWFMESLALFIMGPVLLRPPGPDVGLHWIAGEDYAAQVDAAIGLPAAEGREYIAQGPEAVSMRDAIARFRAAYRPGLIVASMPRMGLALGARLAAKPRYLRALLEFTWATNVGFESSETWRDLGEPRLRIEDYARSIAVTGDLPRK